jgi:glycosyltransferase involved in cell wall biosynthesis
MLGFLAAGMLTILSSFVVHILFGSKYDHAIAGIGLLSFASAMIGILSLFVYFHLARRSFAALTPWIGVALSAILITLRHSSITTVATTMLVVSVLTLLVIALPALVAFLVASARENGSYKNRFEPNSHGLPPAEIDFTLVVPFYNPGSRFGKHVGEIIEVLTSSHINFEILAVSDGSTDHSEDQLSSFDTDRLSLVCLPDNQGKGAALRAGLEIGRGKYLGFIDGDGDLPANLISDVLEIIDREHPDIVFGSKRHPRSNVVYPPLRRIYSWAYQQMNRALFHLPVRDTQTGVKVIRRDVLSAVLPRMVEKRFAFDLELFVVARQQGFKNFVEMPVTIRDRFTSTISVHSVRNMLIDTLAIFYRLKVLRFYERDIRGKTEASLLMPSIPDENITISVGERTQSTQEPKLRILILNWRDITHPNAGGAEVYTHTVANEWLKKGHSVTLFSAAVEGRPEYEDLGGIHIIRRGSRHGVYREAKQYYRREGRGNFDLVIDEVNTRPFGAPKWVDDVPVTALIHQVCREIWSYQTPFPVSFIGRYILEPLWLRGYRDVAIVTLSDSSKESLKKYGLRRVVVVPVGHQPLERLPDVARETVPTLVFVGRLTPNKRPEDAIRAFGLLREKISDAVLWVIGTGPLEDKLRMSAPDGVQFLGKISPYEKTERLARAHALVATSVREGWGLVVTEAAAVGTPTIAYDVAGLRDSVSASKGVLSEPNPSSLCSILFDFLTTWPANSKDVSALGVIPWSQVAEEILAVATGSPQPQYTCILNTRTISAQNGDHLSTAIEPSDSVVLLQGDGA